MGKRENTTKNFKDLCLEKIDLETYTKERKALRTNTKSSQVSTGKSNTGTIQQLKGKQTFNKETIKILNNLKKYDTEGRGYKAVLKDLIKRGVLQIVEDKLVVVADQDTTPCSNQFAGDSELAERDECDVCKCTVKFVTKCPDCNTKICNNPPTCCYTEHQKEHATMFETYDDLRNFRSYSPPSGAFEETNQSGAKAAKQPLADSPTPGDFEETKQSEAKQSTDSCGEKQKP